MNIIQDTREQNGWDFSIYEESFGVIHQGLKEGDYTTQEIVDLENRTESKILCIERKASTAELSNNLGKTYKRFKKEMDRMSLYDHAYIICEFSLENVLEFPENSTIPKKIWPYLKMTGNFIQSRIKRLEEEYGFQTIYAGSRDKAERQALEIFKEIHDAYNI